MYAMPYQLKSLAARRMFEHSNTTSALARNRLTISPRAEFVSCNPGASTKRSPHAKGSNGPLTRTRLTLCVCVDKRVRRLEISNTFRLNIRFAF